MIPCGMDTKKMTLEKNGWSAVRSSWWVEGELFTEEAMDYAVHLRGTP